LSKNGRSPSPRKLRKILRRLDLPKLRHSRRLKLSKRRASNGKDLARTRKSSPGTSRRDSGSHGSPRLRNS
jgi:hypothetical protein